MNRTPVYSVEAALYRAAAYFQHVCDLIDTGKQSVLPQRWWYVIAPGYILRTLLKCRATVVASQGCAVLGS
jgi:hypothetical protein